MWLATQFTTPGSAPEYSWSENLTFLYLRTNLLVNCWKNRGVRPMGSLAIPQLGVKAILEERRVYWMLKYA